MLSRSRKILNAAINSENVNHSQGHNGAIVTDSNYLYNYGDTTSKSDLPVTENPTEQEGNVLLLIIIC